MVPITPELLDSYLKNELDPQTTEYVDRWLRENRIERDMLPKMLHPSEGVRIMASLDPEKDWLLMNDSRHAQRAKGYSSILKVAATLVFAILAGYFWLQNDFDRILKKDPLFFTIANYESVVKVISLDDGSQVHLNHGAAVTYAEAFKTNRHVQLSGEAFFDVASDPQHPFRIETADCHVEVKGTSFNVYSDSLGVEVAVSSGVVQFTTPSEKPLMLEQGQRASFTRQGQMVTKSSSDHSNIFAWRTRLLVFQKTPLDQVVHDMSRYFQRDIQLRSNPNMPLPEFTSRFENPPLTEVLEEMKTVLHVTYTIEENVVLIRVKGTAKH